MEGNRAYRCVEIFNFYRGKYVITNITAFFLIGENEAVVADTDGSQLTDSDGNLYVVTTPVSDLMQEVLRQQTITQEQNRDLLLQGLANLTNVSHQIRADARELGQHLQKFYDSFQESFDFVAQSIRQQNNALPNSQTNTNKSVQSDSSQHAVLGNNSQQQPQVTQVVLAQPEAPPIFRDTILTNPVRFLQDLEKYFKRVGIANNRQLEVALDCLQGPAHNWATIYKLVWHNFIDFRKAFLQAYWSEQEQGKLRHRILTDVWSNKYSMVDHFAYFVNLAQLLTNPFAEGELVSHLMRHFPVHIQSLWSLTGKRALADAAEFLRHQENLVTFRNEGTQGSEERKPRGTIALSRSHPYKLDRTRTTNVTRHTEIQPGASSRRMNVVQFVPETTTGSNSVQGNGARSD